MKFLIDECLSQELAHLARARGHLEAAHIAWLGLSGTKDWELMPTLIQGDWTFVTKNFRDFRGHNRDGGLHAAAEIHAGLVCLNGPKTMDLDMMVSLFAVALDALDADSDLVNAVLEITFVEGDDEDSHTIGILRYSLPTV
jgi:hypothetical protein